MPAYRTDRAADVRAALWMGGTCVVTAATIGLLWMMDVQPQSAVARVEVEFSSVPHAPIRP